MINSIQHLEVYPTNDGIRHDILVNGKPVNGVTGLVVSYAPDSIPQAEITLNSVSELDEDMAVTFDFRSESVDECIQYLRFMTKMDDDLQSELIKRINDVLDAECFGENTIAKAILDALLR